MSEKLEEEHETVLNDLEQVDCSEDLESVGRTADTECEVESDDVDEELTEEDSLKVSLDKAETALKEEMDKRYRAYAELENFRKRKEQEVQSFQKYAAEKVVLEMLPVLDNIELALKQTEPSDSNADLLEGFRLIQKQFKDGLEKLSVTKIEADGASFDPNFHQAMSQEDSETHDSGMVVRVMQEGYQLHERVIRPSLVVVAS